VGGFVTVWILGTEHRADVWRGREKGEERKVREWASVAKGGNLKKVPFRADKFFTQPKKYPNDKIKNATI